jgi:hypothetical protein
MAEDTTRTAAWRGRPTLAWATRIAIFVVPFVAAMVVAFFLSSQLPVASALPVQVVRWLAIVVVSTIAMMGVDRLARRLLPLSVLLKLTLVFPDHAPSRFGVAMRTGTTAQLRKRLEDAREVPSGETPQEAAERLLQLVGLLSQHDRLTRGHSERVRAYSHLIGEELGLTGSELDKLRWAALLHDVGKTAIDPAILNKPGRLDNGEFDTIKTHPDEGRVLVAPLADWLGESVQAVWQHHERFDGRGYPLGLSGSDISFAARVVSVADSYDVMTSARSYKKPMSAEAARAELATCSGTQFDPIMVRAFLNVSLGRLRLMTGPLAWVAQLALFEPSGVVHASAATQSGSAASSAGVSTAASTATAAAASTGSASVASTVAATAASVVASTVGIVAASPVAVTSVASAGVPITVAAQGDHDDLPTPQDTVLVLDSGQFVVADGNEDDQASELASGRAQASETSESPDPEGPDDEVAGSSTSSSSVPTTPAGELSAAVPPRGDGATSSTTTSTTAPTTAPTTGQTATTSATAAPTTSSAATTTTTTAAPGPTTTTTTTAPPPTTTTVQPTTTRTTTTTTVPPTTSTTSTTTTTTSTTTTTTTTTSTTTTTTTTTAPPTTTTTVPPTPPASTLYLGGGVVSNIVAPAFHGIINSAPPNVGLPNLDTDRDSAAGALVQKDAVGISGNDPTKVLKFSAAMLAPLVIDDDVHVEMYVAAKDFERKDIDVEVGIYRCNLLNQCTLLDSETKEVRNADEWKETTFHLHDADTTIGAGDLLEIRVAVLDGSEDDGWFAFGTQQYDSRIEFR